jgi:cation diffusion facilitator CzcD-associated flavoprotein CzcO
MDSYNHTNMNRHTHALIVGAGFSGLASAIKLQTDWNTTDYQIYDRDSEFGGTWQQNTYPGAASDIPALWYCLASDPKVDWKEPYPSQEELRQYIKDVAEKYNLRKRATFGAEIEKVEWLADQQMWKASIKDVATGNKYTHTSRVVFMGKGCLVVPNKFKTAGIEDFKGPIMHTAQWDHSVDYKGKNVVVIGNGCSAVQVCAAIAPEVGSLTQFARTPQWMVPRPEWKWLKTMGETFPFMLGFVRFLMFLTLEANFSLFRGGWYARADRAVRTWVSTMLLKWHLPKKYHENSIPKYELGCKRIIYDCGYWKALHQKNVELTYDPIVRMTSNSVITKSGQEWPADIVIDATGFNVAASMGGLEIVGETGENLVDFWNGKVSAYETVMVANYPNMFFLFGPNATTGHNSVIFAIENALKWIENVASDLVTGSATYVTVKNEAYDSWTQKVHEASKKMAFSTGGCVSWYMSASGAGHNGVTYPWTQFTAWWRARFPVKSDMIVKSKKDE